METIDVVKTFITALQSGDMELAANTMTDDFKASGLLPGRELNARELLALQSELLVAMPDFSYNLTDVQEEGDEVKALVQITGTQTGDLSLTLLGLRTIPATGIAVDLAQLSTHYRVAGEHPQYRRVVGVRGRFFRSESLACVAAKEARSVFMQPLDYSMDVAES